MQYVTERRMAYAKQLLFETKLSAGEIAEACGYRDRAVFFKAFKHLFGNFTFQIRSEAVCLSGFFEALRIFANIRAASAFLSCEIQRNLAFRASHNTDQILFGKGLSAARAFSLWDLFNLLGFSCAHCQLPLISILKPVSLAARRAFCPSLPIARDN